MAKEFFWKDKSGRGFSNTLNQKDLISAFTKGNEEDWETDYNGENIVEWIEFADEGDEWENAANKITRTK